MLVIQCAIACACAVQLHAWEICTLDTGRATISQVFNFTQFASQIETLETVWNTDTGKSGQVSVVIRPIEKGKFSLRENDIVLAF